MKFRMDSMVVKGQQTVNKFTFYIIMRALVNRRNRKSAAG